MEQVARWLAEATDAVVFTGAGISTESGIPDFRSPGTGIWTRYDPRRMTFQRYLADREVRKMSWGIRKELLSMRAEPNDGHRAIARLEQAGRVRGVITQNVDRLHQAAGSRNVLELHGHVTETTCLTCGASWPTEHVVARVDAGEDDPMCTRCGGIIKPATISFGQPMPHDVVEEAHRWSVACDLFVVVGSSLVVYPAAALPAEAASNGARLVIINREPTPLDDMADAVLRGEAGAVLRELVSTF